MKAPDGFEPEAWERAEGKARRWMKAAYGATDKDELEELTRSYYGESLVKAAPGQQTFNRKCIVGRRP